MLLIKWTLNVHGYDIYLLQGRPNQALIKP